MGRNVTVVGAGIAGLAAAHRLQQFGFDVEVLEATGRIGGRMSTDRIEGHIAERGAQFLTSRYSTLIPLIEELGLSDDVVPTPPFSVIVKNGRMERLRVDRVAARIWYAVRHAGSTMNLAKLVFNGSPFLGLREKRKDDYADWAAYDDEDAARWWSRKFGWKTLEYLIEPMFEAFFFHPPEGASKALALWLASFHMAKGKTLTMKRGLGTVTEALAAGLDVKMNTPVLEVRRRHGQKPLVISESGARETDYIVVATPAPIAKQIVQAPTQWETPLLATRYASTIVVTLATSRNWSRDTPALKDAYGLLVPRRERGLVGAIGIETSKSASHTDAAELLTVMTEGVQSPALLGKSDLEILVLVLADLETYFPGIGSSVVHSTVVRWKHAQTLSSIGRARLIRKYREKANLSSPVLLAGDYMGIGSTDSAAQTGEWAAAAILDDERTRHSNRPSPRIVNAERRAALG